MPGRAGAVLGLWLAAASVWTIFSRASAPRSAQARPVARVLRLLFSKRAHLAQLLASALHSCLPQLPGESNLSEEALAARVDTLVKAHLLQVTSHMLALQTALASAGGEGTRRVPGHDGWWCVLTAGPGNKVVGCVPSCHASSNIA